MGPTWLRLTTVTVLALACASDLEVMLEIAEHEDLAYVVQAAGSGWRSNSTDPCAWEGVVCNDADSVTSLDFSASTVPSTTFLKLAVPNAETGWAGLPSLETILLVDCGLEHLPPLAGMALRHVDLSDNALLSSVTTVDDLLSELSSSAAGLKTLNLRGVGLSGSIPSSISSFANLVYVDLSRNGLVGSIPSHFFNGLQHSLQYLYLNDNMFTALPELDECQAMTMRSLWVHNNDFSDQSIPDAALDTCFVSLQELRFSNSGVSLNMDKLLERLPNYMELVPDGQGALSADELFGENTEQLVEVPPNDIVDAPFDGVGLSPDQERIRELGLKSHGCHSAYVPPASVEEFFWDARPDVYHESLGVFELLGDHTVRPNPIEACRNAALRHGVTHFGLTGGNHCYAVPDFFNNGRECGAAWGECECNDWQGLNGNSVVVLELIQMEGEENLSGEYQNGVRMAAKQRVKETFTSEESCAAAGLGDETLDAFVLEGRGYWELDGDPSLRTSGVEKCGNLVSRLGLPFFDIWSDGSCVALSPAETSGSSASSLTVANCEGVDGAVYVISGDVIDPPNVAFEKPIFSKGTPSTDGIWNAVTDGLAHNEELDTSDHCVYNRICNYCKVLPCWWAWNGGQGASEKLKVNLEAEYLVEKIQVWMKPVSMESTPGGENSQQQIVWGAPNRIDTGYYSADYPVGKPTMHSIEVNPPVVMQFVTFQTHPVQVGTDYFNVQEVKVFGTPATERRQLSSQGASVVWLAGAAPATSGEEYCLRDTGVCQFVVSAGSFTSECCEELCLKLEANEQPDCCKESPTLCEASGDPLPAEFEALLQSAISSTTSGKIVTDVASSECRVTPISIVWALGIAALNSFLFVFC